MRTKISTNLFYVIIFFVKFLFDYKRLHFVLNNYVFVYLAWSDVDIYYNYYYRQVSNIRRTLVGN